MNPKKSESSNKHILHAYGVLTGMQGFENAPRADVTNKPILINDLLAYVSGRQNELTPLVEQALNQNLAVRRQYKQLLQLNNVSHIAKPRAAHSDEIFEKRIGEHGVLLKLKKSKAQTNQYYLILEIPEALAIESGRNLVLHANTNTLTQRCVFPPLHDNRAQVILDENNPILALFQDHDVEIDIQ